MNENTFNALHHVSKIFFFKLNYYNYYILYYNYNTTTNTTINNKITINNINMHIKHTLAIFIQIFHLDRNQLLNKTPNHDR